MSFTNFRASGIGWEWMLKWHIQDEAGWKSCTRGERCWGKGSRKGYYLKSIVREDKTGSVKTYKKFLLVFWPVIATRKVREARNGAPSLMLQVWVATWENEGGLSEHYKSQWSPSHYCEVLANSTTKGEAKNEMAGCDKLCDFACNCPTKLLRLIF